MLGVEPPNPADLGGEFQCRWGRGPSDLVEKNVLSCKALRFSNVTRSTLELLVDFVAFWGSALFVVLAKLRMRKEKAKRGAEEWRGRRWKTPFLTIFFTIDLSRELKISPPYS